METVQYFREGPRRLGAATRQLSSVASVSHEMGLMGLTTQDTCKDIQSHLFSNMQLSGVLQVNPELDLNQVEVVRPLRAPPALKDPLGRDKGQPSTATGLNPTVQVAQL